MAFFCHKLDNFSIILWQGHNLVFHLLIVGSTPLLLQCNRSMAHHLLSKWRNFFNIPVDSGIKVLILPFTDTVFIGFGPMGPHLLNSVVLFLQHIHSFENQTPSCPISINIILWELNGVLIGMKNCIQIACLWGNDNSRSLTKQCC